MSRVGWLALASSVALFSSCGHDQAFRIDERVRVIAPEDRAEVTLPLTVRWEAQGLEEPSFGVFVDRAPVRPGKPVVAEVTRTDAVFTTAETQVVIPAVAEGEEGKRDRHTATIVLLDGSGRRVGESAWDVVFEVKR